MEDVSIRDGLEEMDFEKVTEMLSKAFWSPDIKIAEVKKELKTLPLSLAHFYQIAPKWDMHGLFPIKLDLHTSLTCMLMKTIKNEIGHKVIKYILDHNKLKDVYQWLLITKDARAFYSKNGFKPLALPLIGWRLEMKDKKDSTPYHVFLC